MWYEISYELLYEDAYINFIKECVMRSDTMSLDIYWPNESFCFFDKEDCLNLGMSEALYESRYEHEKKVYLEDKQLFETKCIPFLERLKKYLINQNDFERKLGKYNYFVSDEILELLLEPKSLSNWGFPNYPDNISFYKNNEPFFICTNHGQSNAAIKIKSKEEYDYWHSLGVFFFEDYSS